jgi:phenylpyruvate tautomerase PptA (4-oxalocrotonate tautomerase family)
MPLITIEIADTVPVETRLAYADAINAGLAEGLQIDPADRFQVIHPLPANHLITDPHFLGGDRRDVVYIRVQMVHLYSAADKNRMFEAIASRLEALGVRPDDVFIAVNEVSLDDWYPGARGKRG